RGTRGRRGAGGRCRSRRPTATQRKREAMVSRAKAVTWFNLFAALLAGTGVVAPGLPAARAGDRGLTAAASGWLLAQAPADAAAAARRQVAQARAALTRGD